MGCARAFNWQQNLYAQATGYTEILVLIFSIVGSWKHFTAAGSKVSSVTMFHWMHTLFCALFVGYHILLSEYPGLCLCDPLNFISPAYVVSFMWTCSLFQRYWFTAMRKPEDADYGNRRFALYYVLTLAYILSFMYGVFQKPCARDDFSLWSNLNYVVFAVVAVDSTILSFCCLTRYVEHRAEWSRSKETLREALLESERKDIESFGEIEDNMDSLRSIMCTTAYRQTLGFVLIPTSMWIGVAVNVANIKIFFVVSYIIPSILMLAIMWRRRYIVISDTDIDGDTDNFDHIGTSFSMTQSPLEALNLPDSNLENLRLLDKNGGLKKVRCLKAKFLIDFRKVEIPSEYSKLANGFELKKKSNPYAVSIEEKLFPHHFTMALTKLYLSNIIVPNMELALSGHVEAVNSLLQTCVPGKGKTSLYGDLERQRQYEEIRKQCDDLTDQYSKLIKLFRVIPSKLKDIESTEENLVGGEGHVNSGDVEDVYLLKPSQEKSNNFVSAFATNLNCHHALFCKRTLKSEIISKKFVSSVTYGAPSAHSLGFKYGGLRHLTTTLINDAKNYGNINSATKLTPLSNKSSMPLLSPPVSSFSPAIHVASQHTPTRTSPFIHGQSSQSPLSKLTPDTVVKQLELAHHYHARKAIVLSQALSALVVTSVDLITQTIFKMDGDCFKQFVHCGILLHSVSLLSTHGKELWMIDDFAAAYDLLHVKLRLEPPRGGKFKEDKDFPSPDLKNRKSTEGRRDSTASRNSTLFKVIDIEGGESNSVKATLETPIKERGSHSDKEESDFTEESDECDLHLAGPSSHIGDITVVLQVQSFPEYEWMLQQLEKHTLTSLDNGLLPNTTAPEITIRPVLFNLGVNEMQSVANAAGSTEIQTSVNRCGFRKMKEYADQYISFYETHSLTPQPYSSYSKVSKPESCGVSEQKGMILSLLKTLNNLIEEEHHNRGKNVDLLLVSCFAARLLNAGRTSSCKSAKDRTSMFQSLEVTRLIERAGWIDRCHEQYVLDQLRGHDGVRLKNCVLNIGKPKYSFNSVQIRTLPKELRPPPVTAAAGET